ncbi:MAG: efflux RND transporter permease subunit [Pseudomonadales bacterium]|nr:efflux RND transporter permease subunit [Pseudomonadales bacterium]
MSRFFIERPVFAWVIAIIVMLAGVLSISRLPIELYPGVAPPTVFINANFPGASAETIEKSVTQIIEQQLVGIDNLRYFSSNSTNGSASIILTFEPEADPDIAQVQTQNKVQGAIPQLPQEVQALGVTVTKANNNFLLVAGFSSTDGSISQAELGDLIASRIQDPIARINGVGNVRVFGDPHAMRIWLDPHKLVSFKLTALDVRAAIQAQNANVSAGQIGGMPAVPGQRLNATITAQSRFETPAQFDNIVLRVNPDGSEVKLSDVARVELGSQSYDRIVRYRRTPSAALAVSLAAGANALETAEAVKSKLAEMKSSLPAKIRIVYPNDSSPFIKLSIEEVIKTLLEAFALVFLVMYLFLQNLRATFIPAIAVPVVLLGTFTSLAMFGFTINTLTMFAIVLTIGLLVDDAIVVVENVERLMSEEGLTPMEATRKSMGQIQNALVGIAVVLSAVFVPMAFFPGSAGVIYRQFSITMVSAICLSIFVALVLSPTLCATFLRAEDVAPDAHGGLFRVFNRGFDNLREIYHRYSTVMTRRLVRFFAIYGVLVVSMSLLFLNLPTSFLPNEDQGILYLSITAPPGSTAERTRESAKKVEDYFLENESEDVQHMLTITGFSFTGIAQNAGLGFIALSDWSERQDESQSVFAIADRARGPLSKIRDADVFVFYPPPIRELGNSSGFDFQLVDTAGLGHKALMAARDKVLSEARQDDRLANVRQNGFEDVPQYKVDVDTEKAMSLGLSLSDINQTLQIAWGSAYVSDFVDEGRIKRVYVQADAPYRMLPEDIGTWHVRNRSGEMVPFTEFASGHWTYGSPKLDRFDGVSSVNIQGQPAEGVSTGDAMADIESIVARLGDGFAVRWSGISYEESTSGNLAPLLYALSILVVFLSLAALYESWAVPLAVILVVPLGILGAVITTTVGGLDNDVYFQVALLTTIGLSAKNAILIVEFAKTLHEQGQRPVDAALAAMRLRFRPIIMTSMAFMLGVTPLALASGAGSASQNAIGYGVLGGMFTATYLATFFVPMFYVAVERWFHGAR